MRFFAAPPLRYDGAMQHPFAVLVGVAGVTLGGLLAWYACGFKKAWPTLSRREKLLLIGLAATFYIGTCVAVVIQQFFVVAVVGDQ